MLHKKINEAPTDCLLLGKRVAYRGVLLDVVSYLYDTSAKALFDGLPIAPALVLSNWTQANMTKALERRAVTIHQ